MKDNGTSLDAADQLASEISELVKHEIQERVKSAVVAHLREIPNPVVQFAPDIKIPAQAAPVVQFSLDHDALAASLATAIRSALAGMPAPVVTVNPKVEVTIDRRPMNVEFKRGKDGELLGASLIPQKG